MSMSMKVKADIRHCISTSDTYSRELEVQWQSLSAQLPNALRSLLCFDTDGKYAAVYVQGMLGQGQQQHERVIRLCDARTLLVPICTLSVVDALGDYVRSSSTSNINSSSSSSSSGDSIKVSDYHCVQLCFSRCAYYLLGSFVLKSTKRKHHVDSGSSSSSVLVMWNIATQSIAYRIRVPMAANYIHVAPNRQPQQPCFFVASSSSPVMYYMDFIHGIVYRMNFSEIVDESQPYHHSTLSIPSMAESTTTAPPDVFALVDTPFPLHSSDVIISYCAVKSYQPSNPMWLDKLSIIQSTSTPIDHQPNSNVSLSTFDISLSGNNDFLFTKFFFNSVTISNVNLTTMKVNTRNTKIMLVMVDRVLVFQYEEEETSFDNPEMKRQTLINFRSASPLRFFGEFYGFPRLTKPTSVNFLSTHFKDGSRKGGNVDEQEIILMSTMQQVDKLQPTGGLLMWDYINQCRVSNNKQANFYSQSSFVTPLRSSLLVFDIMLQPHNFNGANMSSSIRPQAIYGIDSDRRLWFCSNFYCSKFPGPMFPAGYVLIEKVKTYEELEDELDVVVDPRDSLEPCCSTMELLDVGPNVNATTGLLKQLPMHLNTVAVKVEQKRILQANHLTPSASATTTTTTSSNVPNPCVADSEEMYEEDDLAEIHVMATKKELFPSSLFSIIAPPTRIKTGDFFSKVERDRSLGESIRHSTIDKNLIGERLHGMKMETVAGEVRATMLREKSKIRNQVKRVQRESKREEVLRVLSRIAVEEQEQEKQQEPTANEQEPRTVVIEQAAENHRIAEGVLEITVIREVVEGLISRLEAGIN